MYIPPRPGAVLRRLPYDDSRGFMWIDPTSIIRVVARHSDLGNGDVELTTLHGTQQRTHLWVGENVAIVLRALQDWGILE